MYKERDPSRVLGRHRPSRAAAAPACAQWPAEEAAVAIPQPSAPPPLRHPSDRMAADGSWVPHCRARCHRHCPPHSVSVVGVRSQAVPATAPYACGCALPHLTATHIINLSDKIPRSRVRQRRRGDSQVEGVRSNTSNFGMSSASSYSPRKGSRRITPPDLG